MVNQIICNNKKYYYQKYSKVIYVIDPFEISYIGINIVNKTYNKDDIKQKIITTRFKPITKVFPLTLYQVISFEYDKNLRNEYIVEEDDLGSKLKTLKELSNVLNSLSHFSCKGILGEYAVEQLFKVKYPTIKETNKEAHSGDLSLELNNIVLSIEVKNCEDFRMDQIYKFCYDLTQLRKSNEKNDNKKKTFGIIIYFQKESEERDIIKHVNDIFKESYLMCFNFQELDDINKIIDDIDQKSRSISLLKEIDGYEKINEMANNHKLLVTVGELAKYQAQEEEITKLKNELAKYQAQEEEITKLKKELILLKKTLKSILTLVNTPTPF